MAGPNILGKTKSWIEYSADPKTEFARRKSSFDLAQNV